MDAATTAPQPPAAGAKHRFTIYFEDDAADARDRPAITGVCCHDSTSVRLAKKALKYRRVYDRMTGVDVTSPEFDASTFLGVGWCKTQCLKAHCARLA